VDIGTGSGLWCIEVANEYPECRVVGTDLSPVQPTTIPENCDFYIESLLDGLSFPTGSVDYLQARYLSLSFALMITLGLSDLVSRLTLGPPL